MVSHKTPPPPPHGIFDFDEMWTLLIRNESTSFMATPKLKFHPAEGI
jgi:hypothetical protein